MGPVETGTVNTAWSCVTREGSRPNTAQMGLSLDSSLNKDAGTFTGKGAAADVHRYQYI